jgi:hypothetical protein
MDESRPEEQVPFEGLGSADAAALDALMEAGLGKAGVQGGGDVAARARQLRALLGLLESPATAHASLADVTFARVLQARQQSLGISGQPLWLEPALCMDDEEALDAWVMAGYDASRVPAVLRERAQRHERMAGLVAGRANGTRGVEHAVGLDVDLLVDRTLAAVQAEIDRRGEGMVLEPQRMRGGGLRLADIVSIAAVLLIGSAVLFPVMAAVREQSRRAICNDNLHAAAVGMGLYGGSYRDSLPMTTASLGGGRWWDVGKPQHSNSANLYTLARTGYVEMSSLACPGNPEAPTAIVVKDALDWRNLSEISYSYQILLGPERPSWNHGDRAVVLTDRSPVVLRAVRGEMINPLANAPNHRGAGQHVLFNDGTTVWLRTPVLENGDNIWLPRAVEIRIEQMSGRPVRPLSGTEIPGGADDAFVGP